MFFQTYAMASSAIQTYYPTDPNSEIKSVDVHASKAHIQMVDYAVDVPLKIMHGKKFHRGHGITPQKMKIGLKYNDIILQLVVIDKAHKNYMVTNLFTKNASKVDLLPDTYRGPLKQEDIYVSSIKFIESYPLWPANSAARGYDLLSEKERYLIQMFPEIRLELADKLCRANIVNAGIFQLLPQNQNISCDQLLTTLKHETYFKKLKLKANRVRPLLTNVIACAQGGKKPKFCQKINKTLSQKVLNNQTMKMVLSAIKS